MTWPDIKVLQFLIWDFLRLGLILVYFLAHCESTMQDRNAVIFRLRFYLLFWEGKKNVLPHLIFFLWIVKLLLFSVHRQIVEPCNIVLCDCFLWAHIFFSLFLHFIDLRISYIYCGGQRLELLYWALNPIY